MLHEVLIHLLHIADNSQTSKLYELLEFLHPGEKKLLDEIMEIASEYHRISGFCKQIQDLNSSTITNDKHLEGSFIVQSGLYLKAFANGVNDVLNDYKNDIVQLEETFLHNPQLTLSYIYHSVEKYKTLFSMLKSIVNVFETEDIHGCLIMGRLHKYIYSGVDMISNAAKRMISACNVIFYHQLSNWIIYGDLIDIHNEFFICDGKCFDENFLYPEQMEDNSSTASVDMNKRKIKFPPPIRKFYINWNLVPIFINEDTAESILFIGRMVWILRNDPKKLTDDKYQTVCRRDIWDGKDREYYKKLQALEMKPFDQKTFQKTIEECRVQLTKYLWSIMLEQGSLKEHLQLIRDYFALGRGELFNQFIVVAENQIKSSTLDNNTYNLNYIFLETARKIYGENDKSYTRFELNCSKNDSKNNPWSKHQLNFEIKWPLHVIFHPKSIELYNKLFSYLLRLSRTQVYLNKLWHSHMAGQQKIDRRVWTLRQHLKFLVNNLQYYLQVDVIEAQFSILLNAVENANEFEDIIKVHHEFISNLLAKTFVLTPDETHTSKKKHSLHQTPALQFNVPSKIYNVIIRLLDLCNRFCEVASTWQPQLTAPELTELESFERCTEIIVDSLLDILYRLHEKANGQHLLQLLYQLDFNRFFSKNKPNLNLTQNV